MFGASVRCQGQGTGRAVRLHDERPSSLQQPHREPPAGQLRSPVPKLRDALEPELPRKNIKNNQIATCCSSSCCLCLFCTSWLRNASTGTNKNKRKRKHNNKQQILQCRTCQCLHELDFRVVHYRTFLLIEKNGFEEKSMIFVIINVSE